MKFEAKVTRIESGEGNLVGLGNLIFGEKEFVVTGVAICKGEKDLYVSFPAYPTKKTDESGKTIYKDFCHPITKEFREALNDAFIEAYIINDTPAVYENGEKNAGFNFKVSVTPFTKEGSSLVGIGKVTIDDSFVINNISIMDGEKGLFVKMPNKLRVDEAGENKYKDICFPGTAESRELIFAEILKEYEKVKNKKEEIESEKKFHKVESAPLPVQAEKEKEVAADTKKKSKSR